MPLKGANTAWVQVPLRRSFAPYVDKHRLVPRLVWVELYRRTKAIDASRFPAREIPLFCVARRRQGKLLSALHENAGFVKIFDEQKLSVFG